VTLRLRRRLFWRGAILLAVGALGAACVAPARSAAAYEGKAADSASSAVSALRTAILAAGLGGADRSFPPTVSILLSEAEEDADATEGAFSSIQPPDPESDQIRAELEPMLIKASKGLALLRIAARRADLGALPGLAQPLERLAGKLDRFAQEHAA
jgi:hypothetical protein